MNRCRTTSKMSLLEIKKADQLKHAWSAMSVQYRVLYSSFQCSQRLARGKQLHFMRCCGCIWHNLILAVTEPILSVGSQHI